MIEWPLFDDETGPIYKDYTERTFQCEKPVIRIERVNNTAIYIPTLTGNSNLQCYVDALLSSDGDTYTFGTRYGPLKGPITDFPKLDAVRVECYKGMRILNSTSKVLAKLESKVVPLVPFKTPKHVQPKSDQPNILMLGIDSISWLNFRRYFPLSKNFMESNHFVPLYGFTKVGDNTVCFLQR